MTPQGGPRREVPDRLSVPDPDVIKGVATEDVIWSLSDGSPLADEAHGVEAIAKRGKGISSYAVNVEALRTIYGFRGIAFLRHNTADRAGTAPDEQVAAVCLLRDDKIARLDTLPANVRMAEAFLSQSGGQPSGWYLSCTRGPPTSTGPRLHAE